MNPKTVTIPIVAVLVLCTLGMATCFAQQPDASKAEDDGETSSTATQQKISAQEIVKEGNRFFNAGDLAAALREYESAQNEKPDALEIEFNKALSHLKLGELDLAREEFERTTLSQNRTLTDDAMYGLGACDHTEALQKQDAPQEAIGKLESAMRQYQDVLSSNPNHSAAREANYKAASVWRQLKEIQQQQQEQEQQQSEDQQCDNPQQDEQNQNQDQNDQQNQDQQQQNKEDQQQSEQQQQQEQEQEQEQNQQQSQQSEQEKEQQAKEAQARKQEEGEKTREQALRSLRELMDRLRYKKRNRVEQELPPQPRPVEKDW